MKYELRQNKATKQWVIYSSARRKRPRDFEVSNRNRADLPERDPNCPFCPGNEHLLTPVLMEVPSSKTGAWGTRTISNKFPALSPDMSTRRFQQGIYLAMEGYGRHEVIIETPLHNRGIALMTIEEVGLVIETYHRRFAESFQDSRNIMTIIFRNHGTTAGTSLIHPHSQMIVLGIVPNFIRWREEEAQRHFDEFGRCVYCEIIDVERSYGKRVIFENGSFLAFVPYAAEVPFEVWLVPKRHEATFAHVTEIEKSDMAAALQTVLARLHDRLDDPDYNYVINSGALHRGGTLHLHWFLQVLPRLTTAAGFEIGSGVGINPSWPEDDADFLKETTVPNARPI